MIENKVRDFVYEMRNEFFSEEPTLSGNIMLADPDAEDPILLILSVPNYRDESESLISKSIIPTDILFNVYNMMFDNPKFRQELIELINAYSPEETAD